jgi:glycosyltransferase involved in cell wall biosynthesis
MSHRSRLLFLSACAVPQQIKFCNALQKHFEAEFWFYESPENNEIRGKFWLTDFGNHCKILKPVLFFKSGILSHRYWSFSLIKKLKIFNPDIVMLGGFSIPSNIWAYLWAKRNGKKTIVFTERSRDQHGVLREVGVIWRLLIWLYRDVDMVMVTADDVVKQFRDEFRFGEAVVLSRYAADIDVYLKHPLREKKPAYIYLFANRMTETYNPIGALEIFAQVLSRYPNSRLLMNAVGELAERCKEKIKELKLENSVEFLTNINSWDELHKVYARSDILIFPAHFSNGNWTILEAMASGMGIVVSDRVLGMDQIIEDETNCFKCEPKTEEFLYRIERYIKNPQLFKIHANLNRIKVKPFSMEETAKDFAAITIKKLNLSS